MPQRVKHMLNHRILFQTIIQHSYAKSFLSVNNTGKERLTRFSVIISTVFFLFFFQLLLPLSLKAKTEIDSLQQLLSFVNNNEERIELLCKISDVKLKAGDTTSLVEAKLALDLATNINSDLLIAKSIRRIGNHFRQIGWYSLAQDNYFKELGILEKRNDIINIGETCRLIGETYRATKDYANALKYLGYALKYFENDKNQLGIARTYNRFAAVYFETNYYIDTILNKIINYAQKSLDISEKYNEHTLSQNNYTILGACYQGLRMFDKALEYLNKALNLSDKITDRTELPNILCNIAITYLRMGNLDKAEEFAFKAKDLAEELHIRIHRFNAITTLSYIYKEKENWELAYHYLYESNKDLNQIYTEQRNGAILELQAKYETERKEKELQSERSNVYFLTSLIIILGGLSALVFIYFFFRQKLLKKQNSLLQEKNSIINSQKQTLTQQTESLTEINASKDKLFSIIAHDLKNPVAAVKNLTSMLKDEYETLNDKDRYESIELLNESTARIHELLNNLLLWARSQRGDIKFVTDEYDLNLLAKSVIDTVKPITISKGITIQNNIPMESYANIDASLMNIVLSNLIVNAIKFSYPKGTIEVNFNESDAFCSISVVDHGVGIEPEVIDKLFRIDSGISTTGTAGESGTGLGLMLCKEFVEKHEGKLKVESKPGKGSAFIIFLPKSNLTQPA
jgi:signal transduction histidine kinase